MGPMPPPRPSGQRNGGNRSGTRVWVLSGDIPVPVPMAPGISDGAFLEVLSGDLTEGQLVVTSAKKIPGKSRWQRFLASLETP